MLNYSITSNDSCIDAENVAIPDVSTDGSTVTIVTSNSTVIQVVQQGFYIIVYNDIGCNNTDVLITG